MKATVWLWPFVTTLLCASQFVCTAQREFQVYEDSSMMQDEPVLLAKRTKPSLSIVNPLDVLRQRLLLEIARREMSKNIKQVEINRQILRSVGKRDIPSYKQFLEYLDDKDKAEDNKKDSNDDDDFQIRYLYSLHKNRYTKK